MLLYTFNDKRVENTTQKPMQLTIKVLNKDSLTGSVDNNLKRPLKGFLLFFFSTLSAGSASTSSFTENEGKDIETLTTSHIQ